MDDLEGHALDATAPVRRVRSRHPRRHRHPLGPNVVALFVATWILSGVSYGDQWWTLFIAALVFTLVNGFVKPILAILSIPFIIVTLGIFYFLINVLMLFLTSWLVPDFDIDTFWWGCLAAIIVSLVNWILAALLPEPE